MKNKIYQYVIIRLLILTFGLLIIYRFAIYLLPKNIREDQFSFIGEINLIVNLSLAFYIAFSGFIYFEYLKFKINRQAELKKMAVVTLVINLVMVLILLFLSFNL